MTKRGLTLSLVLLASAAAATPAAAVIQPVENQDLNHFIGSTLYGAANANLGTVTAVNANTGEVAVVGREGQLANISMSVLIRDGWTVKAPELSVGDIQAASDEHSTIVMPTVRVIE